MVHAVQDKDDFDQKLNSASENQLVVIDFHATWCGPCKQIAPFFEELSQEHGDVLFLKVDVDEVEDVASLYDVSNIPKFVFLKNKDKVGELLGANQDKLKSLVTELK